MYKAIALERAGAFCIRVNNSSNAKKFVKQALAKYHELGVRAKFPLVEEMLKESMEVPPLKKMKKSTIFGSKLRSISSLRFFVGEKKRTKQTSENERKASLGGGKDNTTSTEELESSINLKEKLSIDTSGILCRKEYICPGNESNAEGSYFEDCCDEIDFDGDLEDDMNSSFSEDMGSHGQLSLADSARFQISIS